MVIINSEGKFNENTYLFDGKVMGVPNFLSVYIIENDGLRLMVDTPGELYVRKFIKKLQELGIYPIHKILLTHSHCDHIYGAEKLKQLVKEVEVEILASENAVENLKNPEKMNDIYKVKVNPIKNVIPLKDGDVIDLNGLELSILNLFGHTMDSIGIIDKKNRNLFPGDAIIFRTDYETFTPMFMPPDFHESELLKTFQKVRNMRNEYASISLPHYGVWKDNDKDKLLDEMEDLYHKPKKALIEWYNNKFSIEELSIKFCDTFIPNSTKESRKLLQFFIGLLIESLKISGFVE